MLRLRRCFSPALAVACAAVLFSAAQAIGQSVPAEGQETSAPAAVLRPGDMVRLKIWREPDLSGDFIVDENGVVIFPMIGPYAVADESPETLKVKLTAAYQDYLRHPSIEVRPMRRLNILGAVRTPGLYPVDATMTLGDALALAGGSTPQGNPDKVDLVRDGKRITTRLSQGTRIGDLPLQSGDQLFVPERSWFSRNSNVIATSISASVSLFVALIVRR